VNFQNNKSTSFISCFKNSTTPKIMIIKRKLLAYTIFSSLNVTFINTETHQFTESSPAFPLQRQASYDHQSLPLETECHLLQSPHNWILEADVKQSNKRTTVLSQLHYYKILITSNLSFIFQICHTCDMLNQVIIFISSNQTAS